ncbi:hypothetical protein EI555_007397, partial [Monodon monoceros]
KGTLRRKDTDSSTTAKLRADGGRGGGRRGRDHHAGGQWREEESGKEKKRQPLYWAPLASGGSKKSREGQRVAGGPGHRPSQGHVARACRCRPAPRVGRAAAEWPPGGAEGLGARPCGRPLRPSPLISCRPGSGRLSPRVAAGCVQPTHPDPRRAPATSPSSPRPPRAPALREEEAAAALGSRLTRRTPPSLVLLGHAYPGPSLSPELPPVRPRVFTGTRGGGDSCVPRLRWQPVPSPDHSY